MLHEAKVYSWASKTGLCAITWIYLCFSGGSASACCTGIEESWVWTGSEGLQLLGSIGKLAESHIGYTCGHNHFAVNRSWGKTWETPRGFPETPETPLKPPMSFTVTLPVIFLYLTHFDHNLTQIFRYSHSKAKI